MSEILKKSGFVAIVLVLSAGIYWLIFLDQEQKETSLDLAMNLLGNKLMAMVNDDQGKQSVQELFTEFSKKAKNREISPERVEFVAANIFNISSGDNCLSQEEAEAILKLSMETPLKIERQPSASLASKIEANSECSRPAPVRPVRPISDQRWDDLGERIHRVNEFERDMQRAMKDIAREKRHWGKELYYRIDKDLKIKIDAELKAKLHDKEFKHLAKEMRRMEREHLLEWRKNFRHELRQEMRQLREELKELRNPEHLKELQKLEYLPALKSLENMESLEHLKSLEKMKFIPPVIIDADSIAEIVEESLKAAGIDTLQ